ncbi:PhoH family protein [Parvicella tangerina]|uniref:PhoH-like protein n=1 Tax=Parvicella tangerina TaxID=2829795 RepID=A0A916JP92_9FLAO|nr:PhoH family protein [Parvicella tangerina]CAG5085368.1 PhoH-like protein [Parvicella tangerina]
MQEKTIDLSGVDMLALFGPRGKFLKIIQAHFSKVKFVHRGTKLSIVGETSQLIDVEKKLKSLIKYLDKYNSLNEGNVTNILNKTEEEMFSNGGTDDVIVYGNKGHLVKARTVNQRKMVDSILGNDMLFAIGPAGTGKTYTAVALAVRALKNKEVRRIVLTRPAVEAGENLGFLPGDLKDKLDPYLQPLYDGLRDMIPREKLEEYLEDGVIQIAPLAFMRGRTLDKAFVILDEAQNTTENQMKMFLTRMGKSAKFIITGDVSQIDLPKHQRSGLTKSIDRLKGIQGIDFVFLDEQDVIRHQLVKRIIDAFD